MTVVAFANVAGQARGAPIRLTGRRRRLSSVVARHRPAGRNVIVSVHRNAAAAPSLVPSDATVRMRADWCGTLIGPRDVVLITILPLGGGSGSGGGKSAVGIGLAIASIALIAIAPYAAPVLAGSLLGLSGAATGTLATAIQAGIVVGGLALGAAAQLASSSKTAKNRDLYSVSGGGNLPRPGGRKPLLYGRCWSNPPLSQRDFFRYDGDTMVLTKRMTLGLGKYQIHTVKVGDATFWTAAGGLAAPFNLVAPGSDPASATAIEFLYETASAIAVGDAISSGSVAGQELPRPSGNPDVTPWFRLTPQGVVADQALLSWTYPGVYRTSSAGRQVEGYAGAVFTARRIDPVTGTPIGAPFQLLRDAIGPVVSTTAIRSSRIVRLPAKGAYEVQAQNLYPASTGFTQENKVTWDELVGLVDDVRIRPATTEIVMRIRAGAGLSITAFSDITVEATRILPVWTGGAWIEQPTRKAVWAVCDLVRNEYGLDAPDGFDRDKALAYAGRLTADDTFDGVLPEVASYWQAAAQILLPLRADPVKVGAVHSFVRDESSDVPRHVLTRRQIVRDSGSASYQVLGEGGDVIVEFDRDGDPRRPDEARYSYGPPSRTPKRYKVPGIANGDHALRHAKWLALVSVFRGASRTVVTEWDGRLIYPGDHVLSDLWFLKGPSVFGVAGIDGNRLTLDCDADLPPDWGYGSIRTRLGREWGILRMRGIGVRGIELHADDVAALGAATGLALGNVLARDSQDPTTIVVGELAELQASYVVRAAIPTDADHVRIEMLLDDTRIWALLDEPVYGPTPVGTDPLAEPLQPAITVLRARCERIETGIEVVWSLAPARGARSYAVWLSYDGGATREPLSNGPATSGRAPLRQSGNIVTLIAVAYGGTGLPGAEKSATFTTVAPVVRGELVDVVTLPAINYAGLAQDVQSRIAHILDVEAIANANTAAISSEQTLRQTADSSLASRIDVAVAAIGDNKAAILAEQQARVGADGSLASQIAAVLATTNSNTAAISAETTARTNADGAFAGQITDVYARTDAGTALGRFSMQAVSAPSGVTARIQALLASQRGGQTYGAGYYLDLLSDGSSRFVIDANAFYITANGSTSPAFQFDGYTLTIPSLRVTQTAILPGAASDRNAPLVQNIDCGASSSSWREIPGTAIAFTPDALWSSVFAATAQGAVTAVGTSTFLGTAGLSFAIAVDGTPLSPFATIGGNAGQGGNPNVSTTQGPSTSSPASFEMTASGQSRRVALVYKFECTSGGSGKINFAQLKILTSKR